MTDYAPGPWHAHKTGIVTFYGTRRIQVATARQPLFTAECQEANARLIAAAPDLLEACQTLATLLDTDDWIATGRLSVKQAQAAIAKATGAQS
jgi:hypothetical protein